MSDITEAGLGEFHEYYGDDAIGAEDLFAYAYAVLHDPIFRARHSKDLEGEFPSLPFYEDFWDWAGLGQKLVDLHIGFEEVEPYRLERVDFRLRGNDGERHGNDGGSGGDDGGKGGNDVGRVVLRADKEQGIIRLDDKTALTGVPADAWRYVLGSRSALEWVLAQYKEKKPKDPTIAEKFNTYRFSDYKERVIDLLRRVCTVSVGTMEIVDSMAHWEDGMLVTYRERETAEKWEMQVPPWFDEPEDEEWLAAWQELPWLERWY